MRPNVYTLRTILYNKKGKAGDENRTRVVSLEGKGSTIKLHPQSLIY